MDEQQDHYAMLGISSDADAAAIRQAFRRLARAYHPDVRPGVPEAAARFRAINAAYQVLRHPDRRQAYDRRRGHDRRGKDIDLAVELSLEEAFAGTTRVLQRGAGWIEAHIPPGLRHRARMRVCGQGEPGTGCGPAGDLFLVVHLRAHARFRRHGDDLIADLRVDLFTAAAGGEVCVEALGGPLLLRIPPRTQAGATFRLRGQGMPRPSRRGEYGDLYMQVTLVLPDLLTDREIDALRALAQAREQSKTAP
jgi:curved DNA-binding protein